MPRITKTLPPDRADYSFGDLVYWHLFRNGTRPSVDPSDKVGRVWETNAICRLLQIHERTLRNWIRDRNLPDSVVPLSNELFGDNSRWDDARIELQRRFEEGWALRRRRANSEVAEANAIESSPADLAAAEPTEVTNHAENPSHRAPSQDHEPEKFGNAPNFLPGGAETASVPRTIQSRQPPRLRALAAFSFVALLSMAGLALVLLNARSTAEEQNRYLMGRAAAAYHDGFCDRALRYALAALPPPGSLWEGSLAPVFQAQIMGYLASSRCPFQAAMPGEVSSIGRAGSRLLLVRDEFALLWDTDRASTVASLGRVASSAFQSEGNLLLTSAPGKGPGEHRTYTLWNAETGQRKAQIEIPGEARLAPEIVPALLHYVEEGKTARLVNVETKQEIAVLRGHRSQILKVVFSSNGSTIATTADDSTIRIWSAATGDQIYTFADQPTNVEIHAVSDDGRYIVTSSDREVRILDLRAPQRSSQNFTMSLQHLERVHQASFSPDGKVVLQIGGSRLLTKTLNSSQPAALELSAQGEIRTLSKDKTRAFVTAVSKYEGSERADPEARLIHVSDLGTTKLPVHHPGPINAVTFSDDGRLLATGGNDGVVRIWDARDGKLMATLAGHSAKVTAIAIGSDNRNIVTSALDGTTRIWRLDRLSPTQTFVGHTAPVTSAQLHPEGRVLATTSEDGSIRLWDAASGQGLAQASVNKSELFSVGFSRDGSKVLAASYDGVVRVWSTNDLNSDPVKLTHGMGTITTARFGTETRVVTGGSDGSLNVWDATSHQKLASLNVANLVESALFNPDGSIIATVGKYRVWDLWRTAGPRQLPMLLRSGGDETLYLKEIEGGGVQETDPTVLARKTGGTIAFSPDGSKFYVTCPNCGRTDIWETSTGRSLGIIQGLSGRLDHGAMNAYGDLIVVSRAPRGVEIWHLPTKQLMVSFANESREDVSASFSPDGRQVVIASEDALARIFNLDPIIVAKSPDRVTMICAERLKGATSFSDAEMEDPVLAASEDLRDPCTRVGPLRHEYYSRKLYSIAKELRMRVQLF